MRLHAASMGRDQSSRISRRPIRASKVTDIHPVTNLSSLRLPLLAGIGKTSVVEAFLQTLDSRRQTLNALVSIARGQCIEHYGVGEAYLPVLEALGRLCRTADGHEAIALLRQQAQS